MGSLYTYTLAEFEDIRVVSQGLDTKMVCMSIDLGTIRATLPVVTVYVWAVGCERGLSDH
jgi:hypothetical protein